MNIFHFFTVALTVKTGFFTFCEEVSTIMRLLQFTIKIPEQAA